MQACSVESQLASLTTLYVKGPSGFSDTGEVAGLWTSSFNTCQTSHHASEREIHAATSGQLCPGLSEDRLR